MASDNAYSTIPVLKGIRAATTAGNPQMSFSEHHGRRGTPAMIDVGFDTSAAFHHYAIEGDPGGMRWFVDDELVFARDGDPPLCRTFR